MLTKLSSILIASFYGYIHNQITYSISEEYFTRLKFIQFNLWDEAFQNNGYIKAGFVGIMATWWLGAIIDLILGILIIFIFNFKKRFYLVLKHIFYTIVTAILFGVIGFIIGKLFINDLGMGLNFISSLEDSKSFAIAGSIHNFSYLGSIVGLIFSIYLLFKSKKQMIAK